LSFYHKLFNWKWQIDIKIKMLTETFSLVIFIQQCVLPTLGAPTLWNISVGPMPPLQPKELGVELLNYQYYTLVSNNEVVLDLDVPGYQFNSYSQQCQMATTGGEVNGIPSVQLSYSNYLDPSSDTASMLAHYNDQTCTYSQIEGESPYPGYDYYQNLLLSLYYGGIPVYFEYVDLPDYGLCMQFTATPPWISDDLPRSLTYTLTFQNSTGYLLIYALVGTEYCCPGLNLFCPNSGLCSDGSEPQLTQANTTSYYGPYQIYANDSWSPGFFGPYCPFTTTAAYSSGSSGLSTSEVLAIVFGALFALAVAVIGWLVVGLGAAEKTGEAARICGPESSSGGTV
jgi:hypothetical protein